MPRRKKFHGSPTIQDIIAAQLRAREVQAQADAMIARFEARVHAKVVVHHRARKPGPKPKSRPTISLDVPSRASKKYSVKTFDRPLLTVKHRKGKAARKIKAVA